MSTKPDIEKLKVEVKELFGPQNIMIKRLGNLGALQRKEAERVLQYCIKEIETKKRINLEKKKREERVAKLLIAKQVDSVQQENSVNNVEGK